MDITFPIYDCHFIINFGYAGQISYPLMFSMYLFQATSAATCEKHCEERRDRAAAAATAY